MLGQFGMVIRLKLTAGLELATPRIANLDAPAARLLNKPQILRVAQDDIFSWNGGCLGSLAW
jgi:hypothetical protein